MAARHLAQLLATRAVPDGTGCLIWRGARDADGYGVVQRDGRRWLVHRVVTSAFHGPPSSQDSLALHSCDRPSCVNPLHLRWGSAADNLADARERGRWPGPQPTCRRGHDRLGPNADQYLAPWGQLVCRPCRRLRDRQRRAAARQRATMS